jgi:hypothetical protein
VIPKIIAEATPRKITYGTTRLNRSLRATQASEIAESDQRRNPKALSKMRTKIRIRWK